MLGVRLESLTYNFGLPRFAAKWLRYGCEVRRRANGVLAAAENAPIGNGFLPVPRERCHPPEMEFAKWWYISMKIHGKSYRLSSDWSRSVTKRFFAGPIRHQTVFSGPMRQQTVFSGRGRSVTKRCFCGDGSFPNGVMRGRSVINPNYSPQRHRDTEKNNRDNELRRIFG
jgi:hypothetical protein